MEILIVLLGMFFLYLIIANAVRVGVKEAYHDLKEDIIKEFNQKNAFEKERED